MEKTLIVFKPDAVMRGIVGEILTRFERVGLKIVGAKMLQPDYDHYFQHYEGIGTLKTRKGDDIFETQMREMQQGPVIAMVLEGVEAVEIVRKMVGPTEPKSAQPGTIRGDYAHMTYGQASAAERGVPNVLHASADKQEADQEIAHWFAESELVEYENVHEHFTQPKSGKRK
ncbi:MAG TPA: nucleoside-diphosphate kinase [Candidatus Saccharimonadales bacterium]|nr:nucleoside-diphosphate kinase [Candidatus Saccharimonadales bacterium]